jgi:RNA polymerase sigma-70 factor (ECF subfamily)
MAVDVAMADDAHAGGEPKAVAVDPAEEAALLREKLLLARLRRRDERAFAELVRSHQDRVYDLCCRMLNDREEALDVAQEVFVSLHGALAAFRGESRLSTWIFRIAKNHCLNRLKYLGRRQRSRTEELADVSEGELAEHQTQPSPQEALLGKEQAARVQRAIAQLPEEQRLLIILRDLEGLTYDEMVQITEQPEGTVKSRLHRARAALAEILGKMQQEERS